MRAALALAVLLAFVPAARADRGWLAPQVAVPYPSNAGAAAVDAAGDTLAAEPTGSYLYASVDGRADVTRISSYPQDLRAAGGGDALALTYVIDGRVQLRLGTGGGLGPAIDLGKGGVFGLVANAAGDMAELINGPKTLELVYRPAGGAFGAPQAVPGLSSASLAYVGATPASLAIAPDGGVLVGIAGNSVQVVDRTRAGAWSAPVTLPGPALPAQDSLQSLRLAAASNGAAIALWTEPGPTLGGATRVGGAWRSLSGLDAMDASTAVATDAAGDGVLAWPQRPGNAVHAATVSLPQNRVLASFGFPMAGLPVVASAPDGTTTIGAADATAVHAVRRDGTRAFGPVEQAACGTAVVDAGFDGARDAVLGVLTPGGPQWSVVRDGSDAPGAETCRPHEPPVYSVRAYPGRAVPGQQVALTAYPPDGWTITSTDWDIDEIPGYERHEGGTGTMASFGPGRAAPCVDEHLRANDDGTVSDAVACGLVLVPAQITLTAPQPQRGRNVLRRGLRVTVGAAAPSSVGASVRLDVMDYDDLTANADRTVTLTAQPRTLRLRFVHGRRLLRRALAHSRHVAVGVDAVAGGGNIPARGADVDQLGFVTVKLRR